MKSFITKTVKNLSFVLSLFLISNIQIATAQQSTQIPSDLQNTLSEIEQIYLNKDADRRASGFIEEGVHITGWGQAVKGREAIRQLYEKTFSQLGELSKVEIKVVHATISDEKATLRGRFMWEGINANGEEFSQEIHMAALLKKIDSQWKFAWDLTGPQVNNKSPLE